MKTTGGICWELVLSPSWSSQSDEECESILADDGLGALQISTAQKDEDVTDADLQDFADDAIQAGADYSPVQLGAFRGIALSYDADGTHWRRWYLRNGSYALFASYNCHVNDKGKEGMEVDRMLSSLRTR